MMTNGPTGYIVNNFTVEYLPVIPKWANGVAPYVIPNSISVYTLTITKTSVTPTVTTPTYTVIGSYMGYI
jgi:hypothetical protein